MNHFCVDAILCADALALIERISCVADPALNERGHTAVDVDLRLRSGDVFHRQLDIAPGFPGNDLSDDQHLARFADCMAYAPRPLPQPQAFVDAVQNMAELDDARALMDLLQA